MYIANKYWEKPDKAVLVGKNQLPGKNNYKEGTFWYGLFLAPKIRYCLTMNKFGVFDEHKTLTDLQMLVII